MIAIFSNMPVTRGLPSIERSVHTSTLKTSQAPIAASSLLRGTKTSFLIVTVAGITVFAQPAVADTTVCASGCAYTNIQAAITAAPPDGGVIRIRPGIYEEKLVITNKSLRLIGAGSAVTVVDGTKITDGSRVISLNCAAQKQVAIDGVTITGGLGEKGFGGGGLENFGCKVALDNCLVTGNAARGAGGIVNFGIMRIWNTVISNNTAADLGGGGINNSGTLEVTKSAIINNFARTFGGGITNSGTLTGRNVTLAHNSATSGGGGIANTGLASLTGYRILDNSSGGSGVITRGGGGVWNLKDLTIKYSLIMHNRTTYFGGGIYNRENGDLKLVGDFVTGNVAEAAEGSGGGLFNNGGSVIFTEGTKIVNNEPNNCNDGTCP